MNFIQDLKENVYCRLGISKIHGVGVFAIRDIPKGINPMREQKECEFSYVQKAAIEQDLTISKEIKQLIVDMCPENDGFYAVPSQGLNCIGIAWYLNHSETPNMEEKDGDFYSLVDIPAGTELLVNYGTYGILNL